jgi:hypothetical protein
VDIGLLICGLGEGAEVESSSDALTGEPRKMLCAFRSSDNGPEEVYAAAFLTIGQTIGQDLERSRDKAMIWVVKASPATRRSIGILQQLYAADRSAPSIHSPPPIGETSGATLADAEVLTGVDKQSGAVATVVRPQIVSSPAQTMTRTMIRNDHQLLQAT